MTTMGTSARCGGCWDWCQCWSSLLGSWHGFFCRGCPGAGIWRCNRRQRSNCCSVSAVAVMAPSKQLIAAKAWRLMSTERSSSIGWGSGYVKDLVPFVDLLHGGEGLGVYSHLLSKCLSSALISSSSMDRSPQKLAGSALMIMELYLVLWSMREEAAAAVAALLLGIRNCSYIS